MAQIMKRDGKNCGVILLKEAEAVLNPNTVDLRKIDLFRKRYLLLLLRDVIRRYDEGCAATPESAESDGKADLHRLAAAMGCREVLEDFLEMIQVVRHEKGRVDFGAQRAIRMYEEAIFHETLDTEHENLIHSVREVLQLCRQETSVTDRGCEDTPDNDSSTVRNDLRMAFHIYDRANGYRKLANIKQDMAAFRVAQIYEVRKGVHQKQIYEVALAKRRKNAP